MSSKLPIPSRGQRALAAIVVTDAVGFSARMSVDEERTLGLIRHDLALMENQCQAFDGQVLKSTGDGLLMYFVSAVQAVGCAIAIQKAFISRASDSDSLAHRIGIHMGDVFFNQSDVMGNSVNIAARLQTQAKPGGICLSQLIYDLVKVRLSLDAEFVGPLKLKNIQDPISVYHLNVAGSGHRGQSSPSGNYSPGAQLSGGRSAPDPHQPQPGLPQRARPSAALSARPSAGRPSVPQAAPQPLQQGSQPKEVLPEGTKVAGRYTIKKMLGQGGFGFSYLVEDTQRFGELCVLKELRPMQKQGAFLQKAIELFQREAKTLHSIDHPQIPKFLASFTQAKRLFIVQEYIDGITYLKLLQRRKKQSKLFTEAEVVYWLVHMLRVLDYLHSLNIMHRDISPENVMFSRDRNLPILIDFGLVNNTKSDALAESITRADSLKNSVTAVGKFGYSPPEQMYGKCNPSSDLYALGITALVLLTGEHPRNLMDDRTLDLQWQQHATVSPTLARVLDTMIRQQPQERYQSASEVFEQLSPLLPASVGKTLNPVSQPTRLIAPPEPQLSNPFRPDPAFIAQCRDELARCIGPIADMVIEETLQDNPDATPQEIVDILAGQITDADRATAFVSHICVPSEALANSQTMPELYTLQQLLKPAFINQCRQVLAQSIGPMASMIVEDILADYPDLTARAFVDRLAKEIPDGKKAQEFRQQLRNAIVKVRSPK
ncbi:protein kinase domain-containing protein [Leptothoe sp. PORK10 BA2]|uniref:protein kinase domain-containing protein n=1 Tax=Leptothoe sp. PORK10 BA2 TaxID=3110254 RepID=UPI002B1EBC6F|nr:protein kinase [Leptothoe sp. PORK10 BA2]MEA5463692.1 protein kinase [Leptothoe sp. PORK10 BA2]